MSEFLFEAAACPARNTPTFANRREVPEQWPDLLEQAAAILGKPPDGEDAALPTLEQIQAMHDVVAGLSDEDLEASRYYAIGGALCYFARRVADPQTKAGIVERAANSLYQQALIWDAPETGLAVGRIGKYGPFNHPFETVTRAAIADLPAANRFLSETLSIAEVIRRYARTPERVQNYITKQATDLSVLTESISINATAGAGFVLRRAVAARGEDDKEEVYDQAIGELIDPEELAALGARLYKVAIGCARLRLDEMQRLAAQTGYPIEAIIQVDDQHELTFDRDYLGTMPPSPETVNGKPPVLHERRLECPALQVGMIPMIMRLMTDIVIRADQLVAADYARRRNR